jgi:hypothetical protein
LKYFLLPVKRIPAILDLFHTLSFAVNRGYKTINQELKPLDQFRLGNGIFLNPPYNLLIKYRELHEMKSSWELKTDRAADSKRNYATGRNTVIPSKKRANTQLFSAEKHTYSKQIITRLYCARENTAKNRTRSFILSGAVFIRIKGNKNTGKEMFELGLCWL